MINIVAIVNQKGGVGKTTLTINLGAALAAINQRVLLIDLDPQGHLTEGVGLQELYLHQTPTLYDGLVDNKQTKLSHLIQKHAKEHFWVIPSSYQMMLADQALYMARNREHRLKGLLAQLTDQFDWVLIDCPPALSNLTDNALNASRQLIVPIQAEATSVRALDLLFDQIESIERGLNIRIRILAVVPNLVQDSALSKRILAELKESVPALVPIDLRKRVLLQDAWAKGCSVFGFEPVSAAQIQTRNEIVDVYRQLADLVVERANGGDKHARRSYCEAEQPVSDPRGWAQTDQRPNSGAPFLLP
jgi:chromosome partitioning protein